MKLPDEIRNRLAGKRLVVSISGGKDSAAMALWLIEHGIDHDRVFMDTGWEHAITYDYLRGELSRVIGPIQEIRGPRTMPELILAKGMFPSRQSRFCTDELKVLPMRRHIAELLSAGVRCVNAVGIRGSESEARSKLFEWDYEPTYKCEVWRPLIAWSEQDVIDIHRRHGLRPNPLYLAGASRVGCWPCFNARKEELRLLAESDPRRIEQIRQLEEDAGVVALARFERDLEAWAANPDPEPDPAEEWGVDKEGDPALMETPAHKRWRKKKHRLESPFRRLAFFQARLEDPGGGFTCWPIDKVIAWSRTAHGGRQFELFATPRDNGCMRWGMCEQHLTEAA